MFISDIRALWQTLAPPDRHEPLHAQMVTRGRLGIQRSRMPHGDLRATQGALGNGMFAEQEGGACACGATAAHGRNCAGWIVSCADVGRAVNTQDERGPA